MRRIVALAALLMLSLLLAACGRQKAEPEGGQPGYVSGDIALTTDGQREFLLRQGETLRSWLRTFTVYEVTGGEMQRIVSGRDADGFATADGVRRIGCRTEALREAE